MFVDPVPGRSRVQVVASLATWLANMPCGHVLRVAVDGPDAAGKTTLADELAQNITQRGRPVVRVSTDSFHQPEAIRRQRGSLSPDGYFRDSFDCATLRRLVLDPLGPGGDRRYRHAAFDYRRDVVHEVPPRQADRRAVLLLDGVFLLREELRDCWEASIFVHVSPEESLRRALRRDVELFGSQEASASVTSGATSLARSSTGRPPGPRTRQTS